jgi:hypothetical protein
MLAYNGPMRPTPGNDEHPDELADNLGEDGPADTAQGLQVESDRDEAGQDQALDDETARQEIEQGGG